MRLKKCIFQTKLYRKRNRIIIGCLSCMLCMNFAVWMGPAEAVSQDMAAYNVILSVTGDAATSMTLTWHERTEVAAPKVQYSTKETMTGATTVNGKKVTINSGIMLADQLFTAELSGLQPETTYYYCIDNGTEKTPVKSFTTAPKAGTADTAFAYFGDVQVKNSAETEYPMLGQLVQSVSKNNPDLAFGMMGGDIVENGVNAKQFSLFKENATAVFSKIPLFSTNGNHESNFVETGKPELYLDEFSLPQNGPEGFKEEFYSFDYGSCHVTVLNSWVFSGEQKVSEKQYKEISSWIDKDLGSSKATFRIVLVHHPIYALANDTVAQKTADAWRPLFEKNGVDLVLCGHQHVYARSYPLTNGSVDYVNGVTYVMGVSGQKFYSSADETKQERVIYEKENAQIIRTNGNQLTLTTVDASGSELDYWTTTAHAKPGQTQTETTAEPKTEPVGTSPSDDNQSMKKQEMLLLSMLVAGGILL